MTTENTIREADSIVPSADGETVHYWFSSNHKRFGSVTCCIEGTFVALTDDRNSGECNAVELDRFEDAARVAVRFVE